MPVKQKSRAISIGRAIDETAQKLRSNGIKTALPEAELFIQHVTGKQRFEIYLNRGEEIKLSEYQILQSLVDKRIEGYPLQYITGKAYFLDLVLEVSPAVLIPRPETEQLVELVIARIKKEEDSKRSKLTIVDTGTGSGAIIISLALKLSSPDMQFIATDISDQALYIASKNAAKYGLSKIRFLKSDLIENVDGKIDVLIANLPYIRSADLESLPEDVKKEPNVALDGGTYGYEVIERLIVSSAKKLRHRSLLFLEIGIGQDKQISQLMLKAGFDKVEVHEDLAGIKRFIIGEYIV